MLSLFRAVFAPPRDLILLLLAGWAGLWLADRLARGAGRREDQLDNLVTWGSGAFVLGGRLLFATEHLGAFIQSPASLISLNVSLFDPMGGLACAGLAAAILMQRKGLAVWPTLDLMTPFLACLSIGLGLSHLASGAAFGRESSVPWAIELWGAARQPTQLYEIAAGVLVLGFLAWQRNRLPAGRLFLWWAALTALSRLVIEGWRGDSTLVLGGFRLAQIVAWLVLAAALAGMELLARVGTTARPSEGDTNNKRTVPNENRSL